MTKSKIKREVLSPAEWALMVSESSLADFIVEVGRFSDKDGGDQKRVADIEETLSLCLVRGMLSQHGWREITRTVWEQRRQWEALVAGGHKSHKKVEETKALPTSKLHGRIQRVNRQEIVEQLEELLSDDEESDEGDLGEAEVSPEPTGATVDRTLDDEDADELSEAQQRLKDEFMMRALRHRALSWDQIPPTLRTRVEYMWAAPGLPTMWLDTGGVLGAEPSDDQAWPTHNAGRAWEQTVRSALDKWDKSVTREPQGTSAPKRPLETEEETKESNKEPRLLDDDTEKRLQQLAARWQGVPVTKPGNNTPWSTSTVTRYYDQNLALHRPDGPAETEEDVVGGFPNDVEKWMFHGRPGRVEPGLPTQVHGGRDTPFVQKWEHPLLPKMTRTNRAGGSRVERDHPNPLFHHSEKVTNAGMDRWNEAYRLDDRFQRIVPLGSWGGEGRFPKDLANKIVKEFLFYAPFPERLPKREEKVAETEGRGCRPEDEAPLPRGSAPEQGLRVLRRWSKPGLPTVKSMGFQGTNSRWWEVQLVPGGDWSVDDKDLVRAKSQWKAAGEPIIEDRVWRAEGMPTVRRSEGGDEVQLVEGGAWSSEKADVDRAKDQWNAVAPTGPPKRAREPRMDVLARAALLDYETPPKRSNDNDLSQRISRLYIAPKRWEEEEEEKKEPYYVPNFADGYGDPAAWAAKRRVERRRWSKDGLPTIVQLSGDPELDVVEELDANHRVLRVVTDAEVVGRAKDAWNEAAKSNPVPTAGKQLVVDDDDLTTMMLSAINKLPKRTTMVHGCWERMVYQQQIRKNDEEEASDSDESEASKSGSDTESEHEPKSPESQDKDEDEEKEPESPSTSSSSSSGSSDPEED